MTLKSALDELSSHTVSLAEYYDGVASGMFCKKERFFDDHCFETTNPSHPLRLSSETRRIAAADAIRDYAKNKIKSLGFTPDFLKNMHEIIFDCSAPVRLSLLEALFFVGNESSVHFLEKLLEIEPSGLVSQTAKLIISKFDGRAISGSNNFLCCLDSVNFVRGLYSWCSENNKTMTFIRPDTPDIIAIPGKVCFVNRHFLGEKAWLDFCEFIDEAYYPDMCDNMPKIIVLDTDVLNSVSTLNIFPKCRFQLYLHEASDTFDDSIHLHL